MKKIFILILFCLSLSCYGKDFFQLPLVEISSIYAGFGEQFFLSELEKIKRENIKSYTEIEDKEITRYELKLKDMHDFFIFSDFYFFKNCKITFNAKNNHIFSIIIETISKDMSTHKDISSLLSYFLNCEKIDIYNDNNSILELSIKENISFYDYLYPLMHKKFSCCVITSKIKEYEYITRIMLSAIEQ